MNIRSLLLGSIAAAGLASGAQAADLGVLTSLDVCDSLGLSGLTISSDTNCLQITGGINYEFNWGDYKVGGDATATPPVQGGNRPLVVTPDDTFGIADSNGVNDWSSKMEAWIRFVATADSDFGPAKAVIKIKDEQYTKTFDGVQSYDGDDTGGAIFDEAYVSIGDSTVIMAGKKGSIIQKGDDEPFNYLGLFHSENVDAGISYSNGLIDGVEDGGHVIQIVSDLGNGISVGAGLEDLNDEVASRAGTAVGYIAYAGDNLTAHVTVLATGVLDGDINGYAMHAGLTGTFDAFKIRAAIAGNHDNVTDMTNWQGLVSGQATFDMFTIALSGEAERVNDINSGGFGGSVGFAVSDGVQVNVGGRYFDSDLDTSDNEGYQVAAQLVAAVTETLKLTGEIGVYGENAGYGGQAVGTYENVFYGSAEVAWAPGGDLTTSLKGTAYSNGGYKATFKAAKTFQ